MQLKDKLAIGFIRAKFKLLALFSKRQAAESAFRLFCTPLVKPHRRTSPLFESAEPLQFSLNGWLVKGHRWNADKPHKVMILHGFSSAAYNFSKYISAFTKKGYQVLAFDALAHGFSEGKQTNALEYSQLVEHVIKEFGPIDGFLAHSFGGIAVSLALENVPHTNQTKLVLIAPATETTSAVESAFKLLGIKDKKVQAEFHKIIFEKSGHDTAWFSVRRALQNIHAQVLWYHDEDDDITPLSDALKVKDLQLSNIEFHITKGLGHRQIYRDNAVKKKVIDFL